MNKKLVFGFVFLLAAGLLMAAAQKNTDKDKEKNLAETPAPVILPVCAYSRIAVTPDRVNDPSIIAGGGNELQFQAGAYDAAGKPVAANLIWYFRGLPEDKKLDTADGHRLVGSGASATLFASGLAAGTFKIAAEATDCTDQNGRPLRGTATVEVYPNPDEPAKCGPILVKNGEREITDEKLIGFINFILRAEVYGPKKLKGYKVEFYLDDKKVDPTRALFYDKTMKAGMDQPAFYWAYMPVWLKPKDDYSVYYRLLKDQQPVCSSANTYFSVR